nr:immunoglobulin light chain junction region [Mus musculus]
CQQSRKVPYTF